MRRLVCVFALAVFSTIGAIVAQPGGYYGGGRRDWDGDRGRGWDRDGDRGRGGYYGGGYNGGYNNQGYASAPYVGGATGPFGHVGFSVSFGGPGYGAPGGPGPGYNGAYGNNNHCAWDNYWHQWRCW